jgi:hypothetical protein
MKPLIFVKGPYLLVETVKFPGDETDDIRFREPNPPCLGGDESPYLYSSKARVCWPERPAGHVIRAAH